jgi:hypothetical protein
MSIKIMTKVWAESEQKGSALLLLLAIADHADDNGRAYPSVDALAEKIRMTPRNTQFLLRKIEQSGELIVEPNAGPRGCNVYTISIRGEKFAGEKFSGVKTSVVGGENQRQKGVKGISPEPSLEPSIESSVKGLKANAYRNKTFVSADGYTQEAIKAGIDAPTFVAIFNLLIDAAGWRALVDADDDTKLNYAKQGALTLIKMGTNDTEKVTALIAAWKIVNEWRNNALPKPKDLTEYASQVASGLSSQVNGKMQKGKGNNNGTYRKADTNSSQHISSAEAEYVMPAKYR